MAREKSTSDDLESQATPAVFAIPTDQAGDPLAYAKVATDIDNAMLAREIKPLDAQRMLDAIAQSCKRRTGIELSEASRSQTDLFSRASSLLELSEAELRQTQDAIRRIDDIRATEALKKKWVLIIDEIIALQAQCRSDPAKFMVYVGRTQERNEYFKMEWFHLFYFEVWTDPGFKNSVLMAPPGHCKTTCKQYWVCWDIGQHPERRKLMLYDAASKPDSEIPLLARIIRSGRYRAIFPAIRIMTRGDDGSTESKREFRVSRKNIFSREPTVAGYTIRENSQGDGFDDLIGDDVCPPEVRWDMTLRNLVIDKYTSVFSQRLREPERARQIFVGTPWNEDDLLGMLAKNAREGRLKGWRIETEKLAIKDDDKGLAIPLWPSVKGRDFLEFQKITAQSFYRLIYQLKARDVRDQIVRWLCFHHTVENSKLTVARDMDRWRAIRDGERWLSIDPATGSTVSGSSRHGAIDAVVTPSGYAFVEDAWFLGEAASGMREWIVDRCMAASAEGRPYKYVIIEAQGGIKGMVSLFTTDIPRILEERGCQSIPQFVAPGVRLGNVGQCPSKEARLNECAGFLERGVVRFAGERHLNPEGRPYETHIEGSRIAKLREHILNFNGKQNTDAVDATTQFILVNSGRLRNPNIQEPPKPRQRQETNLQMLARKQGEYMEQLISAQKDEGDMADENDFLGAMAERQVA